MSVMFFCFLFLFWTKTATSLSVTCNDEGDPAIIAVTVIVDNNDDSKLCVVVVVSVVAGDVIVIVVDENYEGKFLTIVIVFAEYACKTIFSFSLFPGLPVVIGIDQGLNCFTIVKDTIHCFGILFFFCHSCLHCFWWFICWFHIADQPRVYQGVMTVRMLKHLYNFAWELWLPLIIKINNSVVHINQRLR